MIKISCQPIRAVQHAKELIEKDNSENRPNTLIGVVGASISGVTIPLSLATLAMGLPLVSYAASNRKLSQHKVGNSNRYKQHYCMFSLIFKMFARTVSSDEIWAKMITDLIYHFQLTSAKMIGTGMECHGNHVTLSKMIRASKKQEDSFSLCTSMIE